MAMLWVRKIAMGEKSYNDVPAKLKSAVEQLLIENDLGHYLL